jgi:DNA-binding transcriptional LysR family regulator
VNRSIDVRHLRAFVAVAEELHFGRAAQRLRMAQPPLSQLIRSLESGLGAQLFVRTTRSVNLTPAGMLLLSRAHRILHDLDQAAEDVRRAERGEMGNVRLGFTDLCAIELVPKIAHRFRAANPDVQLDLLGTFYSQEEIDMILDDDLDAGIVHGSLVHPALESRVLGADHLVVALPESHPLAARSTVELSSLADESLLTYPDSRGSAIREAVIAVCSAAGFRPRIVQGVQESMALVALVAAGVGVALLPTSLLAFRPPGAVYRELAGPPRELAVTLCWRRNDTAPALAGLIRVVTDLGYAPPHLADAH